MDGNEKSIRYITIFIIVIIITLTFLVIVILRESSRNSSTATTSTTSTSSVSVATNIANNNNVLGVSIGEEKKLEPSLCNNGVVVMATIIDSKFPDYIIIKQGQSVRWINQDTIEQTVTFDLPGMKSQNVQPGAYYEYKFNEIGTFNYHSDFNPEMRGQVIVE